MWILNVVYIKYFTTYEAQEYSIQSIQASMWRSVRFLTKLVGSSMVIPGTVILVCCPCFVY